MTRGRWLTGAALALPLLLVWIAAMGTLNQRLDRSVAVKVPATARSISESATVGPRLVLSGPLFDTHSVVGLSVSPGEDVLFRYRRTGTSWEFVEARPRAGGRTFDGKEVDIPARVRRGPDRTGLVAAPLLPETFALPRNVVSTLRADARLELSLRAGALGATWVEQAQERAAPLGSVVALLDGPDAIRAIGTATERLDARHGPEGPGAAGWLSAVEPAGVSKAAGLDGNPLGAVLLPDGRILVATSAASWKSIGFKVVTVGTGGPGAAAPEDSTAGVETVSFLSLSFHSFAPDGSVWAVETAEGREAGGFSRRSEETRFVRMSLDRRVLERFTLLDGTLAGVSGGFAVTDGPAVRRYRIQADGLHETDRWSLDGVRRVLVPAPDLVVALAREGVFFLRPGVAQPELVLPLRKEDEWAEIATGATGEVLLLTRAAARPADDAADRASGKLGVTFLPAGGPAIPLGEVRTRRGSLDGSRVSMVRRGDTVHAACGAEILVFDLKARKLVVRLDERPIPTPRRIL